MSLVDLAAAAGTSEGSIRQIESGGVRSPGLHFGIRLADALGVDARFLAFGEDRSEARLDALERRLGAVERRVAGMNAVRRRTP